MPSKDEEYSHKPVNKVDVVPLIKSFATGAIKGNTTDLLGLPVDVINMAVSPIVQATTGKNIDKPVGGSAWFRELAGVGVEDNSLAETAGTLVSPAGLEKAMIVPFAKLGKRMNRTPEQQKYAEGLVKKLTEDGINPETIFNLVKGYVEKNNKGEKITKGVISDLDAVFDTKVLDSITDEYMKKFAAASKNTPKEQAEAFKILEERSKVGIKNKEFSTTLGQLLQHPELYELYPELKNVKVIGDAWTDFKGSMTSRGDKVEKITLNTSRYPDEILKTLLHETQHAVQKLEGWQAGGNPNQFKRPHLESALNKKLESVKGTPKEDSIKTLQQNLQDIYYNKYRALPGEQEARFTDKTLDMSQKELENTVLNLLQKGKTPANRTE